MKRTTAKTPKVTIGTGSIDDFFARGRGIARTVDEGHAIERGITITFQHPEEFLHFISEKRLTLFRAVRERPGTVNEIADRVKRNRDAVFKDIRMLAEAGLVTVIKVKNNGHGVMNFIEPVSDEITLEAKI